MRLSTEQCELSDDAKNAMQRGLDAIGEPQAAVIVSENFTTTVQRLDPTSGPYDTDRGYGVVGGRTINHDGHTTIVINNAVISSASAVEIERLLAHEGGHVLLHAQDEAAIVVQPDRSTSGLAWLRLIAELAIEEFRVERRAADAGYPVAGLATPSSMNNQMFDFTCQVFEALHAPESDDVFIFASSVLAAQHRLTISLGYLAGAVVGGATSVDVDDLSMFGKQCWTEVIARSWQERLDLYRRIPPAGASWGGSLRATHLRQAAEVERKLLRDTGFTIQSNDVRSDTKWAFRTSGTDAMFDGRWQQLTAEADLREEAHTV